MPKSPEQNQISHRNIEVENSTEDRESNISPIEELIPGIKNPQEIIDWVNLVDVKLRDLPEGSTSVPSDYASGLFHRVREVIEEKKDEDWQNKLLKVLNKLSGQIVIDIGAGFEPWGYLVTKATNAKGYVAVEPFNAGGLKDMILHDTIEEIDGSKPIPFNVAQEDIFTFLARLPDNSVSILCSGIDDAIFPKREDRLRLGEEIARVLHQNGIFLNNQSTIPVLIKNDASEENRIYHNGFCLETISKK